MLWAKAHFVATVIPRVKAEVRGVHSAINDESV